MSTLKQVAHLAKVSESTASRILSQSTKDSARYAQSTRERVLKIAQQLNYRPNMSARALAKGKSHIIALVYPRLVDSPFSALFITQILGAVETRCRELNYSLLISSPYLSDDGPDESYHKLLSSGYLDGIIVAETLFDSSLINAALSKKIPVVAIGYGNYPHMSRSDQALGTRLIIDHLISLGHHNLGFISVVPEFTYITYRADKFRLALKANGLNYNHLPQATGNLTSESGQTAAKILLDTYPEMTAIVSFNDRMAMGALREIKARGLRVPEDISLTGYDNLPFTADISPGLTTVDQQAEQLGREAVDQLMAVMKGQSPGLKVLEPKLIIRSSTGPART